MERKLLIGISVGVLGAIIIVVALLPGSDLLKNMVPENMELPGSLNKLSSEIDPLIVKLNDISIISVSEKEATLELKFDVSNPNDTTLLLEMISYDIHENGIRVASGEIGERLSGQVTASNYYTILYGYPLTISDKITIKNTGKNPEFWSALQDGSTQWRITGEAFYSTTSAFSGIAGSTVFDFIE